MDTHRKVRITTDPNLNSIPGLENLSPFNPAVLVDGKPLYGVSEIEFKHSYSEGGAPIVKVTLIGVDIDLEGIPEYMVRVVGPRPKLDPGAP